MALKAKKKAKSPKKSGSARLMKSKAKNKKARPAKGAAKRMGRVTSAGKITTRVKQGQRHRAVLEDKFWSDADCGLSYTEDEETHTYEGEEEERF